MQTAKTTGTPFEREPEPFKLRREKHQFVIDELAKAGATANGIKNKMKTKFGTGMSEWKVSVLMKAHTDKKLDIVHQDFSDIRLKMGYKEDSYSAKKSADRAAAKRAKNGTAVQIPAPPDVGPEIPLGHRLQNCINQLQLAVEAEGFDSFSLNRYADSKWNLQGEVKRHVNIKLTPAGS